MNLPALRSSLKHKSYTLVERLYQGRQSARDQKIANYPFNELAKKYLAWINGRQRSGKIKGYIIGQLLARYGALPLGRFNTVLVEQLQTDTINRGLKASSNNKTINVLKHMFSKSVDWDMVASDVLKRIRKVKLLRDESRRLRYKNVKTLLMHVNLI